MEGTEHIQFALSTKNKHSIRSLKKIVGDRVHLEVTRDYDAAIKYVQKEETRVAGPWTWGLIPSNDLNGGISLKHARSLTREEKEDLPVTKFL